MKISQAILALSIGILALTAGSSQAGVSISIGEPGFYGRLDIGGYSAPRLIYPQPVVVHRVKTWYPPIYLRVPPAHSQRWYKYCDRYNACGRPVYFIDDGWYKDVYAPRYRQHHHSYRPPRAAEPPRYYDYKKYEHHPPKRVYPRREYYEDDRDHRGGRHRY
ncbi:MAG: hypothetical protein PHI97_15620 [Desulfobulbus sp.]|nr:hypothetical protein [Desulfobulbus sp.]